MADPRVLLDLEFGFTHGDPLFISTEEGRDSCAADEARIRVIKRPDDQTIEETIIDRAKVNWTRTTKRVLPAEDVTPEPPLWPEKGKLSDLKPLQPHELSKDDPRLSAEFWASVPR